ncbi:MEMO1 family protein [Spirochaetia bacterium]|nr:MEMO1 family protein [Spirochaetia bacterium]
MVSGLFYPDDTAEMETQLRAFGLESGGGGKAGAAAGSASALIAPHGAWPLSGAVAAAAISAAAGRAKAAGQGSAPVWKKGDTVSLVVILGTIHQVEKPGVFFSDSHFFETPLGKLPVDLKISEALHSCSTLFEVNDIPHLQETSVEVLLPLVQFCFPGASIVPILMRGNQPRLISSLARALRIVLEPIMANTLLVISSNISSHADEQMARINAETCIHLLEENRTDEFIAGLYDGRISACGGALIASLLESGLMKGKTARLVTGPLVSAQGERGDTTCYAGIAFEKI